LFFLEKKPKRENGFESTTGEARALDEVSLSLGISGVSPRLGAVVLGDIAELWLGLGDTVRVLGNPKRDLFASTVKGVTARFASADDWRLCNAVGKLGILL
jgi:hypothetical protein